MKTELNNSLANAVNWIILSVATIATLIYFNNFLKALAIAVLIWYLIKKLRDLIALVKLGNFKFPKWLITITSAVIVFLVIFLIIKIISSNFQKLAEDMDSYKGNISLALKNLEQLLEIDDIETSFSGLFDEHQQEVLVFAGSFAGVIGKSLMVVIYVIFMLMEESLFNHKFNKILATTTQGKNIEKIGTAITLLFDNYLSVKIFTSFLTGLLSYVILLLLGVELAALWAFLIFLFNFIPMIGSVVATAFPALFALVQNGSTNTFFLVLALVGAVQILVANLVEPRIMGDRLNISPLVVLLGLTLWGFIWGVAGMLLSVPITAALIIVFGQFENTKPIAILLTKNGEIGIVGKEKNTQDVTRGS
ncbi:AI-2E family transporter [Reichenbachiella agarivorans]|uniref:AI-2E family transporter n=1 Tax=Reichenbachiella agarivorans TaxID=2979464 RepID=A0ABY6CJT2_9BACT|nr:AI-2E family transporter [Reichenbachiella agarivorans]UXP30649.1 AI-2E family transporter [Reichenbachiella agarivorans]